MDSWRAAYSGLVPSSSLDGFTYEQREERFRESLADEEQVTYMAQMDEQVAGFLTLDTARDPDLDLQRTGEIWGIYVSPDYWRQGIGTKPVAEAEKILQAKGYADVVIWILEDNRSARRFYEAMGFRPDGESRSIDWGTPLEAVRYRKIL